MASRHLSRVGALQALFAADMLGDLSLSSLLLNLEKNGTSVSRDDADTEFTDSLIRGVAAKRNDIDAIIEKAAPQWPLPKIAAIDRNILRIGLFELLFGESLAVPPKVALNEAIELAKTFGGDSSGRFVNGVLGSVYRELGSPRKDEAPKTKKKEYLAGVVVCAVKNGELYIALAKDHFGKWTLPKTKYRKEELSDSAALRAAHEELGLSNAAITAPLSEHEYEAHDPEQAFIVRRVAYFLACSPKHPLTPKGGSPDSEARWFLEGELKSIEVYEDLRGIIESGIVAARTRCI